jgi:hypothetical protein
VQFSLLMHFYFYLQTQRNPPAQSLHSTLRLSLKLLGHLINLQALRFWLDIGLSLPVRLSSLGTISIADLPLLSR